jgi:hypothetical protein
VEHIDSGLEHHEEVEQVETIGVVLTALKVEDYVSNVFVDERLNLAGHRASPIAKIVKVEQRLTVLSTQRWISEVLTCGKQR